MDDDPRLTPARGDIAALHLRGKVEADAYVDAQPLRVTVPGAPLTAAPDADAPMTTQLLFGEDFTAYEVEDGWVWGQSALDGYVGYAPEACFGPQGPAPTHRIHALQALVYPEPDLKSRPIGALPYGARIGLAETSGAYVALDVGGWIAAVAARPLSDLTRLWVATAERFLGVPYLWGGRSPAGIDCSGLIQIALQAAGVDCPRDSDQQLAAIGRAAPAAAMRRGDVVFWQGHVGVMLDPNIMLHANAHHMEVAKEPLETAASRIAKAEGLQILGVRRITL